jgi:hypothetical protein
LVGHAGIKVQKVAKDNPVDVEFDYSIRFKDIR